MHILVVAAHPDDIEFGVAGSVARWIDEGAEVTYCIVTDGAAGTDDPTASAEALARTRQEEQRTAAAAVGVTDVRFLGYRDGILEPTLDVRRDITRVIRQVRPCRVVCHDPTTILVGDRYVNHPDHRASGEAVTYAVFPSAVVPLIFPELLEEGLMPHRVAELYMFLTLQPDAHVDISSTIDRKIAALLCHKSQLGPEAGERVRKWSAEAGQEVGCAFAERFRLMRLDQRQASDDD
jgi:LmbE family N-acetylglucosaminyl deacetylase